MPKIKLTKTELKAQQDSLKQFRRFLPTLQLKKQQLQMEIRGSIERQEKNQAEYDKMLSDLEVWISLFGDNEATEFLVNTVQLTDVESETLNIAGVEVPVFKNAVFELKPYDPYLAEPWFFDAVEIIKELIKLRENGKLLAEQNRLLSRELMTTTQRVNLFEKVKIPECRENIRRIRIYIGDMDTSGVARSKIAKKKTLEGATA
ncbi:MAG: V-type ATP synthase subunit D [Victivallaceae bacterium]|jgi:V/A-type H+-transporting ATPase subunit D